MLCGGENYDGSRSCHYEWVKVIYEQCKAHDITFNFIETGSVFVKDGKTYHIPSKQVQAQQAYRSGPQHKGRSIEFKLFDGWGYEIPKDQLYVPHYHTLTCRECASRLTCNGCSNCEKCEK